MSKIPTAEEFIQNFLNKTHKGNVGNSTEILMIEFTKLHVEAALKQASETAHTDHTYEGQGGEFEDIPIYNYFVDKNSILNAYPLENIK